MDKSCQSSADSTTTAITTSSGNSTISNSRDQYLKHLNKFSHKISKPIIKKPNFDLSQNQLQTHNFNHNPPLPPPSIPQPQPQPQTQAQAQAQAQAQQQNLQHQPPVYNINKNDFRDVVQKLTGSPAHERFSTPPPIQQPKPQSSRLQRIRPAPLSQISNRPPLLMNNAMPHHQPPAAAIPNNPINTAYVTNFSGFGGPFAPLSPLPPFPTVHGAAESPVSAHMWYLRNSMSIFDSNSKQFSGFSPLAPLVSPRWNNLTPPQSQSEPQPQPPPREQQLPPTQQGIIPTTTAVVSSQSQFQLPSSPLPFGCLNSPRSPYPLLSPSLLFSPVSGQLGFPQLPLSPTVPVPSPRWRGL
ncbi:putative VQ motif-containing protein [Quillaja saponaria]|uniref:VQ motif-containing protein n=1 Tax=Quillaja saponaria TaxID=32244 RepID=A0AAD7LJ14_QUISA|nr:putative VQ motif-containing protein [Quillaja saponaria]